jgi:transcriptional regulator with XRE-family HTH domain
MNRLKDLREDKDLHQKDIANLIKVDQSNYSKYELEKINIPIETLKKLADFYDTSTDYILCRTDIKKPYPTGLLKEDTK